MDIEQIKLRVALFKERYEHNYADYSEVNDYLIKFFNHTLKKLDENEKYLFLMTRYKQSIYLFIKYRTVGTGRIFIEKISYNFNLNKDENYNNIYEKILINNSYKEEFTLEVTFEEIMEFLTTPLKLIFKSDVSLYPTRKLTLKTRKEMM